ncbi:MAG: lipopolysaccharide biosynthesis protein [Sarcina sp.]
MLKKLKTNNLIKSFIVLLGGEGIASLLGIASMALIIGAIKLEGNGKILSVQAYCILINSILGFKSFQALIKYITISIEKKDNYKIKSYIKQSYILDIVAAIISVIVCIVFAQKYGKFMRWDKELVYMAYIYSFATLFQIQGTPIGILRAYNKFNYITYSNVTVAFMRVIFFILGVVSKQKVMYFFLAETICYVLPNIIINILAFKTLKKEKLTNFYKQKIEFDKEFIKFNFYSNISSTIDLPVSSITTIMIDKYLGYDLISIYKIFEKIGALIGKVGAPIGQIIYPEMNIQIAKKQYKDAKKLNDKLLFFITVTGIVLIISVLGTYKWWLGIFIVEHELYINSLVFYLSFIVFINATVGVHSLFMALGYIKYTIPILLGVNSIYLIIMFLAINLFQLNGVIGALFVQAIAIIIIKIVIMKRNNYKEKLGAM